MKPHYSRRRHSASLQRLSAVSCCCCPTLLPHFMQLKLQEPPTLVVAGEAAAPPSCKCDPDRHLLTSTFFQLQTSTANA